MAGLSYFHQLDGHASISWTVIHPLAEQSYFHRLDCHSSISWTVMLLSAGLSSFDCLDGHNFIILIVIFPTVGLSSFHRLPYFLARVSFYISAGISSYLLYARLAAFFQLDNACLCPAELYSSFGWTVILPSDGLQYVHRQYCIPFIDGT